MQKLISWVEVPANDMDRAVSFYNAVFNLNLTVSDFGFEKMAFFPNNEGAISQSDEIHSGQKGLLVSFNTEDKLDAALIEVTKGGGSILKAKTKIEAEGMGYFAMVLDSEGNKIGLYGTC